MEQHVAIDAERSAPPSRLRSLEPGGAAYADMDLPPGPGRLTVTVPEEHAGRFYRYAVLPFDSTGYPNLCIDQESAELAFTSTGDGSALATFDYDGSCRSATLVISQPDPLRAQRTGEPLPMEAEWTIGHESLKRDLVANTTGGLWEWDGAAWSSLAPAPAGQNVFVGDIVEFEGDIVAIVFENGFYSIRRLANDTTWSAIHNFGRGESPRPLAVANGKLYVLVEVGPDPDHSQLWRYDGGGGWTTVVDLEGWTAGMVVAEFAGKEELVFVNQVDFVGLNPTQSQIWLYSAADGLRQGRFDTPDGPRTKSSPRFGILERRAAPYGGQFFMSVFRNQRLASSNGTEWFWVNQPIHSLVMEAHNGLVYTSSFTEDEDDTDEGPVYEYNGTSTRALADPPDMAWTWFLSHNNELWMVGFRDLGTFVVERGIYRWEDSVGRVSTTSGTGLSGVTVWELLARQQS